VSTPLTSWCAAAAGLLAGLAAGAVPLWRQHRNAARWRHLAGHDDTTGLPNRRTLTGHLRHALAQGRPVGLIMIDLDRFKTVNDTFGHAAGNLLLRAVAARLSGVHGVALAARLSGDEFALIVHGDTATTQAAAHAAWRAISATPIRLGAVEIYVTASVGFAMARDGGDPDVLLHDADVAMYHAKHRRNQVHPHGGAPGGGAPPAPPPPPSPPHRCRDARQQP
jgi:diguanylate cyclase (GGDEF)-like protein